MKRQKSPAVFRSAHKGLRLCWLRKQTSSPVHSLRFFSVYSAVLEHNGGQWPPFRERLILQFFFSSTPLKNKARLVSTEHSYSNCKKLCLNEAVGKTNCENTARTAVAFPLAIKKIFAIRRVLKKKKPGRDALFKNQALCCNRGGNTRRRTGGSIHEEGTLGNS